MKFIVVFSCLLAVTLAKPGYLALDYSYAGLGAPIGLDGRVVDTAEVSLAKAEHAAAYINAQAEQAQSGLRSFSLLTPIDRFAVPVIRPIPFSSPAVLIK